MCNNEECDKPVHAKGLCQPHYRQALRRNRGLQKPGPKPDPSKLRSRHNPHSTKVAASPRRAATACSAGHEFVDGSYAVKADGKKSCRVCQRDRMRAWRAANEINRGYFNARKTECVNGHLFTEENTWYRPNGRGRQCQECSRISAYRTRLNRYGLTAERFDQMLAEQGNACAICRKSFDGESKGIHIDHDHVTGQVRALLCTTCNTGLGAFMDSPDLLQAAIDYLATHALEGQPLD